MDQQIRGIPLGIYPEIGEAKIIYKTPPEYLANGMNQLITLARDNKPETFVMTFWTWVRDYRFKKLVRGTWFSHKFNLSNRHLRAFKKIEVGELP
jgi:hypothetical protein